MIVKGGITIDEPRQISCRRFLPERGREQGRGRGRGRGSAGYCTEKGTKLMATHHGTGGGGRGGDLTDRVGRNLKGIINARLIGVSLHRSRVGKAAGNFLDADARRVDHATRFTS